jgi:hypothetical protein
VESRSLRFWVFIGMALALPLALAAILGYVILHRGIVADFQDVARRQRDQIQRNQRLQLQLWEATDPVLLYLDDSDPSESVAYRRVREQVQTGFARLHEALPDAHPNALRSSPFVKGSVSKDDAFIGISDHGGWAALVTGTYWYNPKTVVDAARTTLMPRNFDSHFSQAKKSLGAPWGADQKTAMAAAIAASAELVGR